MLMYSWNVACGCEIIVAMITRLRRVRHGASEVAAMRVAIDPGHGGSNLGAQTDNISEKVYNLAFSEMLAPVLRGMGCSVALTRDSDRDVDFASRNLRARTFGAQLVLSIHVNASSDPLQRGMELFHWPGNANMAYLAQAIDYASPNEFRSGRVFQTSKAESWKRNARAVVGAFSADCLLIELGYATNQFDSRNLLNPWMMELLIGAFRVGLARYLHSRS